MPLSDRLCDTVVIAFALWTVSAQAVVAAGGGLVALTVRVDGKKAPDRIESWQEQ